MLGSLGWQELLIVLAILALLFGARRIADMGGALGRGIREFRTEVRGGDEGRDTAPAATAPAAPAPAPAPVAATADEAPVGAAEVAATSEQQPVSPPA